MKKYLMLNVCLILVAFSLCHTQQKFLLHITSNGQQEAISIFPNETIPKAIERSENRYVYRPNMPSDTLRYYADEQLDLRINFGFNSQDVAFQWYVAPSEGEIKEFWWRNYSLGGDSKKATIRAWRGNYKLLDLPINAVDTNGRMGYYVDTSISNIPTPFKSASNGKYIYVPKSDTQHVVFDPLEKEAEWLSNGLQVILDSNKWQGLKLKDWGKAFYIKTGEVFGFTLSNDSYFSTGNTRLEIMSKYIQTNNLTIDYSPYHSMKFYPQKKSDSVTIGWQIRTYDWGMYVVVDYTTDGPWLTYQFLNSGQQVTESPRKISAIIKNVGGLALPTKIKDVFLKYKIVYSPFFENVKMVATADTFSAVVPGLPSGKTMRYYIAAFDSFGRRFQSQVQSYSNLTNVAVQTAPLDQFVLFQNYPNPFNPSTVIRYQIPSQSYVSVKVYNILGKEIETLVNEKQEAGSHSVEFSDHNFPSGIYFYQLKTDVYSETRKFLLLK